MRAAADGSVLAVVHGEAGADGRLDDQVLGALTLGLERTLEVLQELTGAESIRQLPTLTMFKINMNLEMEKGTETLAAPGGESKERPIESVQLTEMDYAVIKNLQGALEVPRDVYQPAADAIGITRTIIGHLGLAALGLRAGDAPLPLVEERNLHLQRRPQLGRGGAEEALARRAAARAPRTRKDQPHEHRHLRRRHRRRER